MTKSIHTINDINSFCNLKHTTKSSIYGIYAPTVIMNIQVVPYQ